MFRIVLKNIDLNNKEVNGRTVFRYTCEKGHNDVVKSLINQLGNKPLI